MNKSLQEQLSAVKSEMTAVPEYAQDRPVVFWAYMTVHREEPQGKTDAVKKGKLTKFANSPEGQEAIKKKADDILAEEAAEAEAAANGGEVQPQAADTKRPDVPAPKAPQFTAGLKGKGGGKPQGQKRRNVDWSAVNQAADAAASRALEGNFSETKEAVGELLDVAQEQGISHGVNMLAINEGTTAFFMVIEALKAFKADDGRKLGINFNSEQRQTASNAAAASRIAAELARQVVLAAFHLQLQMEDLAKLSKKAGWQEIRLPVSGEALELAQQVAPEGVTVVSSFNRNNGDGNGKQKRNRGGNRRRGRNRNAA